MFAIFNLFRLTALFLLFLPIGIFNRNIAVFYFLKFAGPSFVKLGQLLSARPDLVGIKMATTLAGFQDDLGPFSEKKLRKILATEYENNFDKIFAEFDYQAIASASIAQVHKAKLQSGEIVAVKILRPNIAQIMERDIYSLKFLVKLVGIFSHFFRKTLADIADLLERVAKSELDLMREAANASRLKEELQGVDGFYVPNIFWKISSSKILVLEWIDGIPISHKEEIAKSPFDKKQIAQNLVISYFTQVYSNGFFHADMHPGNLILRKNGDLAVVDFGIMGQIDKKTRIAIAEILMGFLNKDYRRVAQLHIDAGLVGKNVNVDDLALSCRKIGETIVGSDVKDISVAKLLSNLITMTRDYKMDTRPELLLLQKTILLVEGVGVSLAPDLNIWNLARPWVTQWAKQNIGFDAKIRDTIYDLFTVAKKLLHNFTTEK